MFLLWFQIFDFCNTNTEFSVCKKNKNKMVIMEFVSPYVVIFIQQYFLSFSLHKDDDCLGDGFEVQLISFPFAGLLV